MKNYIALIITGCFVFLMSACGPNHIFSYKEADSHRVSFVKELSITKGKEIQKNKEYREYKADINIHVSGYLTGEISPNIIKVFVKDVTAKSHYFAVSSNKDGYYEIWKKIPAIFWRSSDDASAKIVFEFSPDISKELEEKRKQYLNGEITTVVNPVGVQYFLTNDGKIKQTEFFYGVSSTSSSVFFDYGDIMFDELELYSREVTKTSNTIALEKVAFVSEKNKENSKEIEKRKQEEAKEEERKRQEDAKEEQKKRQDEAKEKERASHYHSGGKAFYALFNELLVGDYIEKVPVSVLQVIGNDGFLAYYGGDFQFLFYVVSKGIKGNKGLVDGKWLLIDGQIIGRYKYVSTGGGQKTIPKVKASKLEQPF